MFNFYSITSEYERLYRKYCTHFPVQSYIAPLSIEMNITGNIIRELWTRWQTGIPISSQNRIKCSVLQKRRFDSTLWGLAECRCSRGAHGGVARITVARCAAMRIRWNQYWRMAKTRGKCVMVCALYVCYSFD